MCLEDPTKNITQVGEAVNKERAKNLTDVVVGWCWLRASVPQSCSTTPFPGEKIQWKAHGSRQGQGEITHQLLSWPK